MNQDIILNKTERFVKNALLKMSSSHDWWHIYRVKKLAEYIAEKEEANIFIVQLGALLHDIAEAKYYNGDESIGPKKAREFLKSLNVEERIIEHIENIIRNISFKNSFENKKSFNTLELEIVQDADRLDALGAIGIARTFHYGGYKGNEIYNPNIKPKTNQTKEEYKKGNTTTINHFYEKLLLLKNKMNTDSAKKIAESRHSFMIKFLEQFYKEWDFKK